MNPSDFMALAERLAAEPSEAELRTAISRAYYGAFHAAKNLLTACGVYLSEGAEAHAKVVYCLQQSQDQAVVTAATALASLRTLRNEADYHLNSPQFRDRAKVAVHVAYCKDVFATFTAASPANVRHGVREYAKNVLRLSVSD